MDERLTLVVDCGGLGIKYALVHPNGEFIEAPSRFPTVYPLSPESLIMLITGMFESYPKVDQITVGMPGMIRHGAVVHTPHYITKDGPFTEIDPELVALWAGFDLQTVLSERLQVPVRVLNDAEIHGYGVIEGKGLEVALTLGTGLGSAWFDDGVLAPHLEVSEAPVWIETITPTLDPEAIADSANAKQRSTVTYDTFIGDTVLRRLGPEAWSKRVAAVVDTLRPVFWFDHLYLGGGNAANIVPEIAESFGPEVSIVPNESALIGGARLWTLPAKD
ncbi:MAG: ROK family protein [Cellulomonadaceae bacterium]|jgi:polyphosphate glucokinase|nr:ROK family protein [Cellulomonadaceae bacterium]